MGKRSDFKRNKGDYYITPAEAVLPLMPFVAAGAKYAEVCAGNGALIEALAAHGLVCVYAADERPKGGKGTGIVRANALHLTNADLGNAKFIITNPPWTREILHAMILRFALLRPTWLLFDADWAHTKQAKFYLRFCRRIVSAGRIKWIADSNNTGKDNAAWYLFDATAAATGDGPIFEGFE